VKTSDGFFGRARRCRATTHYGNRNRTLAARQSLALPVEMHR
jgi:hypothetical protein